VPVHLSVLTVVLTGVAIALCTSNLRPITDAILDAGGLSDTFARRVVQEDVGNDQMKPHPAPYLKALELAGGDGARAVAFEDSAAGVMSAAAAGIALVLGVCNNCETRAEAEEAAEVLVAAGAAGAFVTTADAIDWLLAANSSAKL
jgi:beta-phosphoglucomutase-like phosphatase (HAD superfamily)